MPYRNLEMLPPAEEPIRQESHGLSGGFNGAFTPRDIPPDQSPALNAVRFEGTGVRKDFGYRAIGTQALTKILALAEHKFIRNDQTFHRLIRARARPDGRLVLEVWTGSAWVEGALSDREIQEQYLSVVSAFGAFVLADGKGMLIWTEELEKLPQSVTIPIPTQEIGLPQGIGDEFKAPIAQPFERRADYSFRYSFELKGASADGIRARLSFLHAGEVVGGRNYEHGATNSSESKTEFNDETFVVPLKVEPNEELGIRIESLSYQPAAENIFSVGHMEKIGEHLDLNEIFTLAYKLLVGPQGGGWAVEATVTVELRYHRLGNAEDFVVLSSRVHKTAGLYTFDIENSFRLTDTTPDTYFSFVVTAQSFAGFNWVERTVKYSAGGTTPVVPIRMLSARVEYELEGDPISVFEPIAEDAPGARMVSSFAGRLVAIRDLGDSQSFAWSASGQIRDWAGEGSGQIFLVESKSDATDDLMAFAEVGSAVGALFRKRSIMRAFPTGMTAQAIGATAWIDMVGTESPFSVRNVEGGVMFLGHNLRVYFLNESGPIDVGEPIHRELIQRLTSRLELVDATYDPIFNEYILGIPENNATHITKLWVFSIGEFKQRQRLVWRPRALDVSRLATVSRII